MGIVAFPESAMPTINLKIETEKLLYVGHPALTRMQSALQQMHATVPIAAFEIKAKNPPGTCEYEIKLADGRVWKQVLVFDNPKDPLMTFDINPAWRLSEILPYVELRDSVVAIYEEFGIQHIKCAFS